MATAALGQLHTLHLAYMRELQQLGSSIFARGEGCVLLYLQQAAEPVLSGELARATGLTTGRVANLLKQLEQKGLVCRTQDQRDLRRSLVSLTAAGQACALAQAQSISAQQQALLGFLGERDAAEALRLLERCLRYYREQKE